MKKIIKLTTLFITLVLSSMNGKSQDMISGYSQDFVSTQITPSSAMSTPDDIAQKTLMFIMYDVRTSGTALKGPNQVNVIFFGNQQSIVFWFDGGDWKIDTYQGSLVFNGVKTIRVHWGRKTS